jgi:hypothetical protein
VKVYRELVLDPPKSPFKRGTLRSFLPLKGQGCFILKRKKVETLKSRCILIRYSLSRNEKIGFEILLSKMKQPCLKRGARGDQ